MYILHYMYTFRCVYLWYVADETLVLDACFILDAHVNLVHVWIAVHAFVHVHAVDVPQVGGRCRQQIGGLGGGVGTVARTAGLFCWILCTAGNWC